MDSMTGYGRAEFTLQDGSVYTVEVRSLNHRYIDINVRMPERFLPLEIPIRDAIKKRFRRGSFTISIGSTLPSQGAIGVNLEVARRYLECARQLKEELGVRGDATVDVLFRIRDIFSQREELDMDSTWTVVEQALLQALEGLKQMRKREGEYLKESLKRGLDTIEGFVHTIEELAPQSVEQYRQRLKEEIARLIDESRLDQWRIATEVAIYSDRVNIAEELTRIKSHIAQMRGYLDADGAIGRKLDFLCQELLRETNTIASKSQHVGIIQHTVDIKGELEKIREQVQNIE